MPLTLTVILAMGASSVQHGTPEQCEAWYPKDWRSQVACMEVILTPEQKAHQEKLMRLCDELSSTAKDRGFVLASVTFKDADGESSCSGWDTKDRSSQRPPGR